MPSSREAALAAVQELVGTTGEEAEETPSSDEEAVAQQEEQETAETPAEEATAEAAAEETDEATEPALPDEIANLIAEADIEEEAEAEARASFEAPEDLEEGEESDYEYDPRLEQERKLRIAAEKKIAFIEGQRVKSERKKWEAEAEKFFPNADATQIEASSRRSFLRKAKAEHERLKPRVDAAIAKARAKLEEDRVQILAQAKADAEAAWGKPLTGSAQHEPGRRPAPKEEQIDDAFRRRGFAAGIKEMMRQGE